MRKDAFVATALNGRKSLAHPITVVVEKSAPPATIKVSTLLYRELIDTAGDAHSLVVSLTEVWSAHFPEAPELAEFKRVEARIRTILLALGGKP